MGDDWARRCLRWVTTRGGPHAGDTQPVLIYLQLHARAISRGRETRNPRRII
jgi:hypothetical protein